MKRTEWLILAATAAYSYLFYEQTPGINFLIFSVLITVFCAYRNKQLVREPLWLAAAAGTIISGFAVCWFGTWLPVYANVVSIFLLAAYSYNSNTSIFTALFNSGYSLALCIPSVAHNFRIFRNTENSGNDSSRAKKFILLAMVMVVALIFFFLYRASNPLFEKVTDEINFDFISWGWIFFTLFGFLFMCAFFYHHVIKRFTETDEKSPDQLAFITEEDHQLTYFAGHISLSNELFTGKALLLLVNLVLLSANSVDIYYLYILNRLPAGLTQAQYLHDGTNSLIFSIALAIAILLFYFRGRLNFVENNRLLRFAAHVWIAQNILLVATTAQRNYFYISDYGLTHKRIGVYIFLGLCIIGLATTFIKVLRIKSNWFMFRKNTWVWYVTLVLSSLVNWDAIIATYNTQLSRGKNSQIDFNYMAELNYNALPALYDYYYSQGYKNTNLTSLDSKYEELKANIIGSGWQSTCRMKGRVVGEVEEIKAKMEK